MSFLDISPLVILRRPREARPSKDEPSAPSSTDLGSTRDRNITCAGRLQPTCVARPAKPGEHLRMTALRIIRYRRQIERRVHHRGRPLVVEDAVDVLLHQERGAAVEFFVLRV